MTKSKTGNNQYLKKLNETSVLDLIRTHKSISKAELSQITGLSATAIGVIVTGLLEQGYLYETGVGESSGGRKPVLLELKPHSFYSIGVDLDVNYIKMLLLDITGQLVDEKAMDMPEGYNFEKVLSRMKNGLKDLLGTNGVGPEKLLGIGVSVPGMVDSVTHEVIFAPNLQWEKADLKTPLEDELGVPVYVENEAMSSAICENWLGCCQGVNDFVCINVKSGIGAGIFTGGKLYRGAGGSAGEVGHIVVDENGPKCGCGNYGCLETLASTSRIAENAQKRVRQGVVSSLNSFEAVDAITIDSVVQAAEEGDETARNILMEAARYMGIAISNIVNTLNPSVIVLGKEFVKYSDLVLDYIKNVVSCKALKAPASRVEIIASSVGEKASALGAATIPLKVLFGK